MNETESFRFHSLRGQALRGVALSPDDTRELSEYMARLEAEERDLTERFGGLEAEICRLQDRLNR